MRICFVFLLSAIYNCQENIVNKLQRQIEDLIRQKRELERRVNVQTYYAYTTSESETSEDEGLGSHLMDGLHRHQTHPYATAHHRRVPVTSNSHTWSQPASPCRQAVSTQSTGPVNVSSSPNSVSSTPKASPSAVAATEKALAQVKIDISTKKEMTKAKPFQQS